MQSLTFSQKNIWITGASSGIGFELTKQLLELNAKVIACARNIASLDILKKSYPYQLQPFKLDITDKAGVEIFSKKIQEQIGYLDIVILNAGNCYYTDSKDFATEIIRKNFSVNFFGLTDCIEAALPLLRKAQSPYLVGMTSSAAYIGLPRSEGYGASKAAARHLLQSLQASLYDEKIDVSIICPGFVKTPLTDKNDFRMPFLISSEQAAKKIIDGMKKRTPEINFPKRLIWILKLIVHLPDKWRIKLLAKFNKT